jgi:hypothetical protein
LFSAISPEETAAILLSEYDKNGAATIKKEQTVIKTAFITVFLKTKALSFRFLIIRKRNLLYAKYIITKNFVCISKSVPTYLYIN